MRIAAALAAASALILGAGCGGGDDDGRASTAAPEPALEKVGDFREPIFLAEPPSSDGTVYVVERGGTVRTVAPDGAVRAKPILDLSDDVEDEGEGGLFSIAFAPDGSQVFVSYSAPGGWRSSASIGTRNPARPTSVRDASCSRSRTPTRSTGAGCSGSDPTASSTSEPGRAGRSSRSPAARGILAACSGGFCGSTRRRAFPEVVALGLRNPWRYSFDRRTGDLWIGDVGDFPEEEVNHVNAREMEGADFGWPAREGTAPTKSGLRPSSGAIDPVLTYSRSGREDDPRCAITGGYVVRDPELTSLRHPRHDREPIGLNVPRLASFAEDADGRLYAISLEGPVYRIVDGRQP